ncbi:hypothetical protein LTR17_003985 [Elasticomyces elasticus]|nr:hypothetical protein LTR17_003985 [Elasticomyces elasticus]
MSRNPIGVPTLAYNCAKLPAICNNVHANGGQYDLTNLGNNLKGRLTSGTYVAMHSDTDATRRDARRDDVCPSTGNNAWKNTHPCPEPDQPLVVPAPYNNGGRTVETGGFIGSVVSGVAPVDNHILDPSGDITGMAFTCDEFPPAMSIEGGANGANTYCAPAAAPDCDAKYTRSEQDFQSSAHGEIRQQRVSMGSTTGAYIDTWEFHFLTEFDDSDDAYATRVDYYVQEGGPDGNFGSIYGMTEAIQKRADTGMKHLVSHRTHGNGTVMRLIKQVDVNHGTPDGTHDFDAFATRVEYEPVHTQYLSELSLPELDEPDYDLVKRDDSCTSLPAIPTSAGLYGPNGIASSTYATATCTVSQVATSVSYN